MRRWRTVNKRAAAVRRRVEHERQIGRAVAFTKTARFLTLNNDIQAHYWYDPRRVYPSVGTPTSNPFPYLTEGKRYLLDELASP